MTTSITTIAQSTLKTHWSRYLGQVYNGDCVVRVKDGSGDRFMVICSEDDAPSNFIQIKSSEARRLLSEVCWQVKTGVTFKIKNSQGSVLTLRPFRNYKNALGDKVCSYWADRISEDFMAEWRASLDAQQASLRLMVQQGQQVHEDQIERIRKLVWHVARAAHGMEIPNTAQLDRDIRPDTEAVEKSLHGPEFS